MMEWLRDIRKGGQVQRFHTRRMIMPQDVAQHSFNAALMAEHIASQVDEIDSHTVVMHMLLHDIPEQEIGDTPGHTKAGNPNLGHALDNAEAEWWMGAVPPRLDRFMFNLTDDEAALCKFCDLAECAMTATDEVLMGNGDNMRVVVTSCLGAMSGVITNCTNADLVGIMSSLHREIAGRYYSY